MARKKANTCITKRTTKYQICEKCGLKIRCGNVERHEAGPDHKKRMNIKKR